MQCFILCFELLCWMVSKVTCPWSYSKGFNTNFERSKGSMTVILEMNLENGLEELCICISLIGSAAHSRGMSHPGPTIIPS